MSLIEISTDRNTTLAYQKLESTKPGLPGVLFLGGFRSDMTGTKAVYLEAACQRLGCAFVRFDYFGHGVSSGLFEDGTLSTWLADALFVLDHLTMGPQIVIGSSMGGWLMLLMALQRISRVKALVGIASAPDFIEDLGRLKKVQDDILADGVCHLPSLSGDMVYPITKQLLEDGKTHSLLNQSIAIDCPVRLLHGLADQDVPYQKSLKLAERLTSQDVRVTLIKAGDHRLSEPAHLALLEKTVIDLL